MRPAPASPCGLWITEVTFGGEWIGADEVRVHTSTWGSAEGKPDHFALLSGPVGGGWRPWAEFGKDEDVALSSYVTVRPAFRAFQGPVAVRDRRIFEFLIGKAPALDERVSVVVAQETRQASLDVQATRLGRVGGSARFGGLLGTEEHDPAVEELSSECAAHLRNRSASKEPGWELAGSSARVRLYSRSDRYEAASRMTATW